jgi:cold shock protein
VSARYLFALTAPAGQARGMTRGTVKFYKEDRGWGAISSPELPEGLDAWVHFSVIEMDGYRALEPGAAVEFEYEYEPAMQDSFRFRATRGRPL